MRRSQGVALAASSVLAAALLAALLRGSDLGALRSLAAEVRWGWALALVGALALNHGLRIVRWGVVLDADLPWRRLVATCLVAFPVMSALPFRLGELARPALHARDGVPVGRSVAALLVERILDLVALLLLLGAVALALPPLRVDGVDVTGSARDGAAVAIAALVTALGAGAAAGERLEPVRWIGPPLAALARTARELARDPVRALGIALLTALTWASAIGYTWCALRAVPSMPSSLGAAAATWAGIIATVTALPTPASVGSYEAGTAAALGLYGADHGRAVAFGLGLHAAYLGFVALCAVPAVGASHPRTFRD